MVTVDNVDVSEELDAEFVLVRTVDDVDATEELDVELAFTRIVVDSVRAVVVVLLNTTVTTIGTANRAPIITVQQILPHKTYTTLTFSGLQLLNQDVN